jgi:HK97 family phage prohead protease
VHGGIGFFIRIMDIERRSFNLQEIRAKRGDILTIAGHAAVFNQLSDDLGGFREQIAPGAFADTIGQDDIRALWNHDPNYPLARNKSGTLRLHEDSTGLAIEADLVDEPFERSLIKKIERGDVSQMSFGFMVPPDGDAWRFQSEGLVRTLNKVQLFDVSPVVYPAYPQTDVNARLSQIAAELRKKSQPSVIDDRAAALLNFAERKLKHKNRIWL